MSAILQTPCHKDQASSLTVRVHAAGDLIAQLPRLTSFARRHEPTPLSRHLGWLNVLARGLRHDVYCLEAIDGATTRGILPVARVSSLLFGKFLVSLPYLNYGGVYADDDDTAALLVDRACQLADRKSVV